MNNISNRNPRRFNRLLAIQLTISLALCLGSVKQGSGNNQNNQDWRTFGVMNANQLGVIVYNYGCFGHAADSPSFEWPRNSHVHYGNKFGLIVGGEIVDNAGKTVQIISHSLDFDEASETNIKWWEPIQGYCADFENISPADRQTGYLALKNQPQTWGRNFPRDNFGVLLWPGRFGDGKSVADQEFYYKMNDRFNIKTVDGLYYTYYPNPDDLGIQGIGLEVTARGYQFAARVAEDLIFVSFDIKNFGADTLSRLVTGIYGDPQISGRDDVTGDLHQRSEDGNYVYFWDNNSVDTSPTAVPIGYLGFSFQQTPGNAFDDLDNDGDGLIDESQSNAIDDDQDWQDTDEAAALDPTDFDGKSDDVGRDGVAGTGDSGEGDGMPTPGEPDYELLDLDEVDQLNLTSFSAIGIAGLSPKSRRLIWNKLQPGTFESAQEIDVGLLMGAGYFSLAPGTEQKFSLLCVLAETAESIVDKITIAQQIYHYNFNFLKAPEIPVLQAETGNKVVRLKWDAGAENSFDPILGHDFEGYAVYRSTDGIHWGKPVTNSKGERIYDTPLAQFDDSTHHYRGYHPVDIEGARFYLGEDTGLRYSYTDSNLINGITYYYAVTAYDFGSERYQIAPLECSKLLGSSNVVAVTPRSEGASNLDEIIVVPNPYIGTSIYDRTPASSANGAYGGRQVIFMNLPQRCTIRIFTITGELVQQLEHDDTGGDRIWNLLNKDGLEIASGTYIYQVDAPGLGTTIGRLAVIK